MASAPGISDASIELKKKVDGEKRGREEGDGKII